MRLRTQEMSCQAWEKEAQQPHHREETDPPARSKRPKVPGPRSSPGTAQSLALPLLVHFPQPWASHLENGDNDTYQQDAIKTGPEGGQAQPQCLHGFHQACSAGKVQRAVRKSSL